MKAINIILDEQTDPTKPVFVEIENDKGKSIGIGERAQIGSLTRLRITQADIDLAVPDFDSTPLEHIAIKDCWCDPYLDYEDPETGSQVWVHREEK